MGLLGDIGGTLGRGAGDFFGSLFPFRKGGVVPMANGGQLQDALRTIVREGRNYGEMYLPQARDYLGLQNGGVVSTPMGRGMVASAGMKKPRKKRVQKKKK